MREIFCPYCGEPLTNNCDCEFGVAMEEERMIEEIEERQHDSGFKDFARFMANTFNTMSYIDDPNEDADDNVIYCPDDGE